jgi:hypothetical protein
MDDQVMLAHTWAILEVEGQDWRDRGWHLELRHVPRAGLSRVPTLAEPLGADDAFQAEQWLTLYNVRRSGLPSWTLKNLVFKPATLDPERYQNDDGDFLVIWPGIGRPGGESWYWRLNAEGVLSGRPYRDIVAVRLGGDYFR